MIPKRVFFTKGTGVHKEKLQSFELALRTAGIEKCNIVTVSSILPPKCKLVSRKKGLDSLSAGAIVYCVLSRVETNEPDRLITSSIGMAVPAGDDHYGYISEHHGFGITAKKSADYSEDLAATMLATSLGIDLDPDESYDERKEIYRMSGKIVKSQSPTQSVRGDKKGYWTTVLTAAVFLFD